MPKRRQNKTSSELCSELGVTDVELDYTTADFKNLTSAGLFSRMMRPNLQAVYILCSYIYRIVLRGYY